MREILIGIFASMFFAVTFILNRSMELAGGSWIWSSSLRFMFMIPFLFLIVLARKNIKQVLLEIKKHPFQWVCWSFVGFVLFYAPLTFAASYGPGWLVAGSWQLTIVAGTLLGPLFFHTVQTKEGTISVRNTLQLKSFLISLVILLGVGLIQLQKASQLSFHELVLGVLPVLIASVAYPLGNRKMMEVCGGRLDTFQRVFGMTLVSLPFWFILSGFGIFSVGLPSSEQILQSFIVAICSGVIATTLFFIATDCSKNHQGKLAAVEATQSTQVIFVIIGETLLLSSPLPKGWTFIGLLLIIIGMLLHSYFTHKNHSQSDMKILGKKLNSEAPIKG
ncbi:multidrug resistance efflux transporter family protein [Metabacillus litoralis]|uniref:Multidrug resistance efflux transporter family protein n=1 Tax=Metabacillus litoralis TaxID=152268 RepID=A0A5C6W5B3_9BACI|nr:multidrug resistance efflux transporter family protein [Metabacillus litoralis]TXC92991.1 multidrug resistance efflux transporter family protein [Metabacillus litoralis]